MQKNILALGVPGTQGTPAIKELIKNGFAVSGLVKPESPKAATLNELGARPVYGDLFDEESLFRNMQGMDGVLFIPPIPSSGNPIPELTVGINVVHAAERARVPYLIHTSVDRAGDQESFVGWGSDFDYAMRTYWFAKSAVIDFIKASNIPNWTIFKPAFLMEDFIPPLVTYSFPTLKEGLIMTTIAPETKMGLLSAEDQGKLIAKAFLDPEKFRKKVIPLAADRLTMGKIASDIAHATNKPVISLTVTEAEFQNDERIRKGYEEVFGENYPAIIEASLAGYKWDDTDGYTADPAKSNSWGVKLTTFPEWCEQHKEDFVIDA